MYIGLISDTHGVFTDDIREFLSPVDEIWHAGDFGGGLSLAWEISQFKPLVGVCGNADEYNLRYDYPPYRFFEREGQGILMTHIGGYPRHYNVAAEQLIRQCRPTIFVCGHSHILRVMHDDFYDMMVLNPGACGQQGFHLSRTALRFRLDKDGLHDMEVYDIPR